MTYPCQYYRIAGMTIRVDSDLPITDTTFNSAINQFRVAAPGVDNIAIHHHFALPDLSDFRLGEEIYRKSPWAIYQQPNGWLYLGISPDMDDKTLHQMAFFNPDHTLSQIYTPMSDAFMQGNLHALTLFPTDQILIARLLADRQGCYLHSAGAILNDAGILFIGHSGAGKSTTAQMLMQASAQGRADVEILCDDRNIVRWQHGTWQTYGSWSHGDLPDVSSTSAPLRAICFLHQSSENKLIPITDPKTIFHQLLACVIKPLVTKDWWQKTLDIVHQLSTEVACYSMHFDRSNAILSDLEKICKI